MYSGAAASGIKSSSLSSSTSSSSPSITKHLYATFILWVRLTEIFLLKKHSSISFPIKTQTGDYFWARKKLRHPQVPPSQCTICVIVIITRVTIS